jgi:DNA-binding beta-propeller fold protein YncE
MGPAQIAVSADGTRMVVANRGSSSLSIVAIPEFTELAQVDLGVPHPHGVAVAGVGSIAFVTYEGDVQTLGGVVAVDLETGSELWTTQVGANTLGIAYVDSVPRSVSRGM